MGLIVVPPYRIFITQKCSELGLDEPSDEQLELFRRFVGENTNWIDELARHVNGSLVMVRCRRLADCVSEFIANKFNIHPHMLFVSNDELIVRYATT